MTAGGGPLNVVVLISGSGTNLQAILDDPGAGTDYQVAGVIANRADAGGLERARRAGVPTRVLGHRDYPDRARFDAALAELIDTFEPGLIALAGFMRILTPAFTARYAGRLLNVHPSLLPAYRGLHTHDRVLAAGESEHGSSIHFVTNELDGGPVIIQGRIAVTPDDTPATLQQRVQALEHRMFPLVIRWFAAGRLALDGESVRFDGRYLEAPLQFDADTGTVKEIT